MWQTNKQTKTMRQIGCMWLLVNMDVAELEDIFATPGPS